MAGLTQRMRIAAKAAVGIFSNDSLTQAYGLLRGVLPGGAGVPPTRGTADYLRAYSQMPWLRAVASRIATATARAEWQLYVLRRPGQRARRDDAVRVIQRAAMKHRRSLLKQAAEAGELVQITDHRLLDLIHNANEFQTGFAMRKVTQLHLDLVGDALWLKERDGLGVPSGLWPIPPHWVVATPTPTHRFFRVQFRAWNGLIPDTEFTWFSDTDPLNPYGRGTGAAMALGDELDTDEYAARHLKAFFYNQGRPDLLVWPKGGGNVTEGNIKRLEEDWLSKTQGFFRAFKPMFLSREVEVREFEQNFRSQQIVQLRQFERDTVLQHFGMPPEALGVLENSNRATIDNADYFMARYVVEPRLESQRQVLQERLVPEFDDRIIIEYVSPVQEDKERQLEAAKAAPWALTVDEWRQMMGKGPLEDEAAGALHVIPTTVSPQVMREKATPTPPPVAVPVTPPVAPDPQATEPGQGRRAIALHGLDLDEDISAATQAGDLDLAGRLAKSAGPEPDDLPAPSQAAARLEPALIRLLVRTWKDHASRLDLAAIEAAIARPDGVHGDILALLQPGVLGDSLQAAVRPPLERALLRGADLGAGVLRRAGVAVRMAAGVGKDVVDFAAVNPEAVRWAREHAAALVDAPESVRAQIRLLIARSIEEGIPPDQLAKLIRGVIGLTERETAAVVKFHARLTAEGLAVSVVETRVAKYAAAQLKARALRIARTELVAALNAGQQALWEQAVKQGAIRPDRFERTWLVTDDDRLDQQTCEPMADLKAPIGEPFVHPGTGEQIMHPPAHPQCRCATGLVPKAGTVQVPQAAGLSDRIEVHVHLADAKGDRIPDGKVLVQTIERDEDGLMRTIRRTIEPKE